MRTRTVVDLPAPFGPSSPKTSPSRTAKVTPSSACTALYRLRSSSATIASIAARLAERRRRARASVGAVDLYEYQGKELFRRVGIPVSEGRLATTPEEARAAAEELGGPVVVKAQVLTGGRGKAGGIKLAEGPEDAEAKAREILGLDIRGHVVRKLWIEHASDIAKEYYLSVTFDRGAKKPLFMFTTQGGVEIEQVAAESPDALVRLHVDPLEGFQPWDARRLVYGAGVEDPSEQKQIAAIVEKLYRAFVEFDAMLCEINPLIVTPDGEVKALDSKFTVDDSALFRHPDVAEWRDIERRRPDRGVRAREGRHVREARRRGRDPRQTAPGSACRRWTSSRTSAGGPRTSATSAAAATPEGVVDALEVITRDQQVELDLLQHLRRDHALRRGRARDPRGARPARHVGYPIVVRLDGTNAEEGRQILADAGPREHPSRGDDARRRAARGGAGGMTDIWNERAEAYRDEPDACGRRRPRPRRRVVRAGAGRDRARRRHRRRPRRAAAARGGREVVTVDPAPACSPTSIAPADHLPFADASFDVVACRIAAHHFPDVARGA